MKFMLFTTGSHFATFDASTTPWEYSWEYGSDESFNWIRMVQECLPLMEKKLMQKIWCFVT